MNIDERMRVEDVWNFSKARHLIYIRRTAGEPAKNWTDDPIFQRFRFCNVYRELDAVTDWLRVHWREPHADEPDLWHAFAVARHVNHIPTLEAFGGVPLPWDADKFIDIMEGRQKRGEKAFGAAYMIGARSGVPGGKAKYLANDVLTPLWKGREKVRPQAGDSLTGWHMALGLWHGLGSFMAAQIVADTKHAGVLLHAKDWNTFCASGPGSQRGMNRVMSLPRDKSWKEDEFRLRVCELQDALEPMFLSMGWPAPDAQDVQNVLCEFDKYERTRLSEGKPKQLFRSGIYAEAG